MKYIYKHVKIDSRQARRLQSKGYPVINTDPNNGYVLFEIARLA